MRKTFILTAAVLTMAVNPARAQQVSYDYNRAVDFTGFKTYAWIPGAPTGDPMTDDRIVAAIEAQLAASGVVKAAPGTDPDLKVAYYVGVGRNLEVSGGGSGWVGRTGATGGWGNARTSRVYTGVLGVELRDSRTGSAVWHGLVARDLDPGASPEKRERNLNKAVEKLFKHYPTREKK
jgi:Domain of unknown function (DUF4136)